MQQAGLVERLLLAAIQEVHLQGQELTSAMLLLRQLAEDRSNTFQSPSYLFADIRFCGASSAASV